MRSTAGRMFLVLLLYFSFPLSVLAVTPPTFPLCARPQGVIKSDYHEGTHGIAGDTNSYSGHDTVYSLTPDTLTQCFCSVNGAGIQTNWWNVSSLTEDEVNTLKSQGWNYIPNGALWGLEESAYLAQNANYACLPQTQNNSTSGNSSANNSSTNGTNNSNSSGQVLGTTTAASGLTLGTNSSPDDVLGLAATGNISLIYALALMGITSLLLGVYLLIVQKYPHPLRQADFKDFIDSIAEDFPD